MEKFSIIISLNTIAVTHERLFESRPHLVAPVVLLVEGVHNGFLYEAAELAKYPDAWSGIPLPIQHPRKNGEPISANDPTIIEEQSIGNLFHVHYDADKARLVGEIWIDINKASSIAPEALAAIRGGQRLEVSTGLYFDVDPQSGIWNDQQYNAIARNYRPDHLALLPGGVGACSWSDGCGVRSNKKEIKPMKKIDEMTKRARLFIMEMLSYNELSHDELRGKLQRAVDTLDNNSWMHFVREVYDDFVIYEARGTNPSSGVEMSGVLYKRDYSTDADEAIVLADEAVEVREEKTYVPVGNAVDAAPKPGNQSKETVTMSKTNDAIVQALIVCERTRFTEADAEWLKTLSADQLETMKAVEQCEEPINNDTKVKVDDKPDAKPEDDVTPITLKSYIEAAPTEVAGVLRRFVARDAAEKEAVIDALVANDRCKFTKEQLEAKPLDELNVLAELANVPVDFSGSAGALPETNDEDKIPEMPKVFEKKTA